MVNLAITPKRLGQIRMKKYCPRDLWYLLRQKFKPPFDHFGGAIFKQMEQIQMAILDHYFKTRGQLPKEFAPFTALSGNVTFKRDWRDFQYRLDNGVLLYGEPDNICHDGDGEEIVVIDQKSALNKGYDDPLLVVYETQAIGYSLIAEKGKKLGKCTRGGIFYWEVDNEAVASDAGGYYRDKAAWVPVRPKPHAFEIDYSTLTPLIKEANTVWQANTPPNGAENCEDCKRLDFLFALERSLDDKDMAVMDGFRDLPDVANRAMSRMMKRSWARQAAMREYVLQDHSLAFADDGMIATWEEPWEEMPIRG